MPDYSKTKVYKLVHVDANDEFADVYVGSTCQPLSTRLRGHRAEYRNPKTGKSTRKLQWFDDVGIENVTIVLLENTPCASFEEQRQHERRWCDALKPSLNCRNPYVTREERRKLKSTYRRQHYEVNRDKVQEKNKRWAQENRERVKEYHRQYYQENKETQLAREMEKRRAAGAKPRVVYTDEERKAALKANSDRYKEKNKEKVRGWKKAWDEKNKERVLEYRREKYVENREANCEYAREYYARKKQEMLESQA
jgi:hypothetical protein